MSRHSLLAAALSAASAMSLASAIAWVPQSPVRAIPDCSGDNPPPICDGRPPRPPVPPQPEPPGQDVRVPAQLIVPLVNNAIRGTQLHLNNFGPKRGKSWHKPNDSFVRLPQTLGGNEFRFNVPEGVKDLDCGFFCPDMGDAKFYVQDWNLNSLQVGWQRPTFKLSLLMESAGREIKGFHTGALASLGDNGVPDVEINNARMDVFLRPIASNGRLSYAVTQVGFNANIQATGACNIFGVDICNPLFGYKNTIVSLVETQVRARLNDPALQSRVANAVQPVLNQFGIRQITKVSVSGDDLIIRHR
ncbi:hypothetical protein [Myxacorys almedinensis]|uniref:Uncharacterized protein n=1 Tax=Myxacorys almedinensis A TaxID=2690445 RepID=A0A8J7Z170_9CYAN|nr:hypothetical protein [Myxacorys almedinensis]NDJ18202.1 hypothetical protein [Myxacorys almedinensis A]